ncbi:hypothetical protein BAX51_02180 [Mycoplasmoides gallisepticum]|uniref:DUF5378 domain-containing protein n=1 Tax=Mycoplasmoides gallisepticum TaxID=2096 RepID=UPI0007EEFEF9|nr:DUF5378 domain-containing protein [Mycoplasmoides gallisepticum]OBU80720.1 hypothetical protein BAX51_02180 [Mycoplasmoides gallisepticum]
MQLGTILMIIVSLWLLLIIATSKFFIRFENNYWFWFFIGGFMFFYMIIGRQIQFLIPGWNAADDNSPFAVSIRHSRLLLLDICPFFAIFAGFGLMVTKNKLIIRSAAPIALFGGLINLYGELFRLANQYTGKLEAYHFIFIGIGNDQLYFILHVMTTTVALMLICWTTKWTPRDILNQYLFIALYACYVLSSIQLDRKITNNANGILIADWYICGEYQSVSKILRVPFPTVIPVGVVITMVSITLIWAMRYGVQELNARIIYPSLAKKQIKFDLKYMWKNLKYNCLKRRNKSR